MSAAPAASRIADREFLDIRSKLIDLGALLDRIRRGPGSPVGDPRIETIAQALQLLASGAPDSPNKYRSFFLCRTMNIGEDNFLITCPTRIHLGPVHLFSRP